jgi:hypothetical protein
LLRTFTFKRNAAAGLRKQRVIATHTNIYTGIKAGATLANQDIAGQNFLTTVFFDAKALGL